MSEPIRRQCPTCDCWQDAYDPKQDSSTCATPGLRADLAEAAQLIEEYARHDVTLVCQCCGSGFSDRHREDCRIGRFLARHPETR